jgi:protein TonB
MPPPVEGLKPPAEITADKPTQVRPSGEDQKDVAAAAPPSLEQVVPPAPPPGPAVTSIPTPTQPPPPAPYTPRPQPRPSPLVTPHPQEQPPAVARHQDVPTAPSSPFVNPADEAARSTAEQNYLWQVVSRLRGYRYHANVGQRMEGLTVVQVVIARDGRLLDAQVVRSSGVPAMDQGVLAGVRQGSPYAPLPSSISGPSARFRLPLVSVRDGQ